jgi:hypothetical protein
MPGSIQMDTREIERRQLEAGMWLLPWYDKITGLDAFGGIPVPERVTNVEHTHEDTKVVTVSPSGTESIRWFTDSIPNNMKPEIVV